MFTLQNKNIIEYVSPHPFFLFYFHSFLFLSILSILAVAVFLDSEDKHIAQKKRLKISKHILGKIYKFPLFWIWRNMKLTYFE